MKLNIKVIKDILSDVEGRTDAVINHNEEYTWETEDEHQEHYYHLKLLVENNFIDGDIDKKIHHNYLVDYKISYTGLTLQGHKLLETLQDKSLVEKVIYGTKNLSLETLKQLPALAISALTS